MIILIAAEEHEPPDMHVDTQRVDAGDQCPHSNSKLEAIDQKGVLNVLLGGDEWADLRGGGSVKPRNKV